MCIEREKVDFKSREVNCLKECALALNNVLLVKRTKGKIKVEVAILERNRLEK